MAKIERLSALAQGKGYGTASVVQEITCLQSFFSGKPSLAVDFGGNVGNYTAELRRRNPSLEVHTFEPSATNIEKLKQRFDSDSLVKVVPFAVSDKRGDATLFSDGPGSGLGSLTQRRLDHFNVAFDTEEPVQAIRFEDYWISHLESREIDLAKLDIEGNELAALRGFGTALQATTVLQFEFGGCNIDSGTFFQDFWYFFRERDFEIYRVTPIGTERISRYSEFDEFFSTTNYIAVNTRSENAKL